MEGLTHTSVHMNCSFYVHYPPNLIGSVKIGVWFTFIFIDLWLFFRLCPSLNLNNFSYHKFGDSPQFTWSFTDVRKGYSVVRPFNWSEWLVSLFVLLYNSRAIFHYKKRLLSTYSSVSFSFFLSLPFPLIISPPCKDLKQGRSENFLLCWKPASPSNPA